jgi:pyruvate dehydrogenase E2 component (dihydrolipoamide acetyltransferase)
MAIEVVMPQMGETVLEGTVNTWHRSAGDPVTEGEPLLEIGTDKVDTDIPAPVSGTLAEVRVGEGETVPVATVLAIIEQGDPGGRPRGPAQTNGAS